MPVHEERISFPELKRYSDFPLYNTKAVVQQTGIPAPTLRAWERRYTFLAPGRADNSYRLYSERDIAIIRWLKERVDAGMSISQAIALFRHIDEERNGSVAEENMLHEPYNIDVQVSSPNFTNGQTTASRESHAEEQDQALEETTSLQDISSQATIEKKRDTYAANYDIPTTIKRLLDAFKALDETSAEHLMGSMLAIYPVEQVCAQLIAPALWDIGQLWEQRQITVSVEHFASAFFRGILTNLFHLTHDIGTGPLAIVGCAPGEAHELAPLMLALLLRRASVHVVYLGQSIETAGLLSTINELSTRLVCVSATLPSYVDALAELGQKVMALPSPRPIFAFGGQAFEEHKELIARVPGVYLDGDIIAIVGRLRNLVIGQASQG